MTSDSEIGGFILAGGASTRMGRAKALLEIGGVPLVVRAARLLESVEAAVTVVGSPELFAGLGLRAVADDWPGAGPLGGIATALRITVNPWNLIVACDLPYLTADWLRYLIRRARSSLANALIPEGPSGVEPLCAMYHRRCAASLDAALARGVRKVSEAFAGPPPIATERIPQQDWKAFDSRGGLFKNMNEPADYEEARSHLEAKRAT